ncbi:MAG: glycosyltransferase [Bacteroidia bacterium]
MPDKLSYYGSISSDFSQKPRQITPPNKVESLYFKLLAIIGVIATLCFTYWLFQERNIGYLPLFILLVISLGFKVLKLLHEWLHYAYMEAPTPPTSTKKWSVDMLTTAFPGEPIGMIRQTLEAMVKVQYPHKTYLCDEGNDPILKEICQELGVIHVYRGEDKTDAKAGNINYTLRKYATAEIAVILDPDHIPHPEFLDHVLPYFEDDKIAYVQSIQAYHNRRESLISRGATEQTYQFYGPMMMGMHRFGTVQAIGANCAFRRSALDDISGHAPGLTEDMHTSMLLHAKGWKSIYVPKALTRGEVPSNMAAYYKQQLKWSRGSFDLYVNVLPRIFSKLTWPQRLHYASLPLHFFSGFVILLDILIPILALLLSKSPIYVELDELFFFGAPIILMSTLIRQYSQNWVLENQERGFHTLGGILLSGTWWVFLTGLFCTIFNIKIPYIPTPKQNQIQNSLKLVLPNLFVIAVSSIAIVYGLIQDWSPYSLLMAGLASINIVILSIATLMGQQLFLRSISNGLNKRVQLYDRIRYQWFYLRQKFIYPVLGNIKVITISLSSLFLLSAFITIFHPNPIDLLPQAIKPSEGFYLGIGQPALATLNSPPQRVDIISHTNTWPLDSLTRSVDFSSLSKVDHNALSLVHWEIPHVLISDSSFAKAILAGSYDDYLAQVGHNLNLRGGPLVIDFAPIYSPDTSQQNGSFYQKMWHYVHDYYKDAGLNGIIWMWTGQDTVQARTHYPGASYVDLVGVNITGVASKNAFTAQYSAFHECFAPYPTFIFDRTSLEAEPSDSNSFWISLCERIPEDFPEIQGLILEGTGVTNYYTSLEQSLSKKTFYEGPKQNSSPDNNKAVSKTTDVVQTVADDTFVGKNRIQKSEKTNELIVNGQSFYIKGITYNPGHDWRDAHTPLSLEVLTRDFALIKEMGANTIRRYKPSIYDYNLLNTAQKFDLKVLFGFYFDPKIDYYQDREQVETYKQEVIAEVRKRKEHPSILAWGLGNETWGLLKHHFRPTYLPRVRHAYLKMIEEIAQAVTEIDPHHPVFSAMEHSDDLAQALHAFADQSPTLDFLAINSYYEARISKLDSIIQANVGHFPYLVSEFGSAGYWEASYNELDDRGQLLEQSSYQKAKEYRHHWTQNITPYKTHNIGGVAFCWRDRFEGTATWFGITDIQDRKKPAYYALKELWTGQKSPFPIGDAYLIPPWETSQFRYSKVFSLSNENSQLDYEWYICEEADFRRVGNVAIENAGKSALLQLPAGAKKYRVYVHISDQEGNVVTCSSPFQTFKAR